MNANHYIPAGWFRYPLIKVLSTLKDGTHFSPKSISGPFKYITSKNIKFGKMDLSDISYISEEEHRRIFDASPVYYGDVLLTKDGANTGNASLNELDEEFSLLSSVAILRGKKDRLINEYLIQVLLSPSGQALLKSQMAGQAITRLTLTKIGELSFLFPSLPEQRKIAQILSTWDKAITTTERLLSNRQQQKKALMQRLLTGKQRFAGFEGEWKKEKLASLTRIFDGTHTTPKYEDKGIPFYSVEHLTNDDFQNTKFINEAVYEAECKRVFIEKEDILMTRIGDIGTSKYINWDVKASFYVSLALIKHAPSFDSAYLSHFISCSFFQKELWNRTIHVAFPKKINLGEIGNCEVLIPSLDEQQKIASVLSAADAEITTIQNQLDNLKQQKKALMQQLLTGKRRVKVDSPALATQ